MKSEPVIITREDLRNAITEGVQEAFVQMGVAAGDPIEMQKDFQHLRQWRVQMESVKKHGLLTIVGMTIVGLVAVAWMGIKASLHVN